MDWKSLSKESSFKFFWRSLNEGFQPPSFLNFEPSKEENIYGVISFKDSPLAHVLTSNPFHDKISKLTVKAYNSAYAMGNNPEAIIQMRNVLFSLMQALEEGGINERIRQEELYINAKNAITESFKYPDINPPA